MSRRPAENAVGEAPADALYGPQTALSLRNLAFSPRRLSDSTRYLHALAAVKKAAARANLRAGVLEERLAGAIEAACDEIVRGDHDAHFPVDLLGGGGSIGINMNLNEVIAALANRALGSGHRDAPVPPALVNASQSTADVCHTALRLALLGAGRELDRVLASLAESMQGKAAQFAGVSTLARTCLQDAFPTQMGVLFEGYAQLLRRGRGDLADAVGRLRHVSLGGTVIGTGEGAPPAYREHVVRELVATSGEALQPRASAVDALQNSDDVGLVSAQLALLAQGLVKIGHDLRLLGSGPRGGLGELKLPYAQAGSSFFSGKNNPVVPETVLQCAFQVLGCDRAVQAALEHAELYLNVFDGLAAANTLEALEMLARAVVLLDERCVRGLAVDEARCAELAAFARAGEK